MASGVATNVTMQWLANDGAASASNITVSGGITTFYGSLIVPAKAAARWTLRLEESAPRSGISLGIAPVHGDESNEIRGQWLSRSAPGVELPMTAVGWLEPQMEITVEVDLLAGTVTVSSSDGKCFTVSEQKPDEARLVGIGSIQGHLWMPVVRARSLRGALHLTTVRCELLQRGSQPDVCAAALALAASAATITALRETAVEVAAKVAPVGSAAEGSASKDKMRVLLASLPGRGAQPGPEFNDIQCVEPADGVHGALYISAGAPVCEANLSMLSIGAVVRLGDWRTPEPIAGATLTVRIGDNCEAPLGDYLEEIVTFVEAYRARSIPVLVHCGAGISRSGAACCAVLMRRHAIGSDEALRRVRRARKWVRPNEHFMEVLMWWPRTPRACSPSAGELDEACAAVEKAD